jgi:hypothetical protein
VVDNTICYLNTDLDLWSVVELTDLATFFQTHGMYSLQLTQVEDETWYATFEIEGEHTNPEETIAGMLTVIESLPKNLSDIWSSCSRREFNMGYDCGDEPWAFNQVLSTELLGRLANVGGALRITLYPDQRIHSDT